MYSNVFATALWLTTTTSIVKAAVTPSVLSDVVGNAANNIVNDAVNNALGHAFELTQVDAGKFLKSGPLQMMKAFDKYASYGAVAPKDVRSAAAVAPSKYKQQGSAAANPQTFDSYYLTPVTLGNGVVNLDIDTGSADLWAFSRFTPWYQAQNHDEYRPSSKSTRLYGSNWTIHYGDGSGASGIVYRDRVVVGSVTATSQAVEAATSVSSSFVDSPGDGILGLAFSTLNQVKPQPQNNFFDTVKSTLTAPLFTANLQKGKPGTYTFGYIPSTSGKITYVPVDSSSGFWAFSAGQYTVGSNMASGTISGNSIVDTGTSLLCLPDSVVANYWNQVSGSQYSSSQGGYIFPCNSTLPNFSIQIGSGTFTVPGSLLNYAPVDSQNCFGGLQSSNGAPFNIFGDVFLKAVIAVFDQTQSSPRLGFASK